MNVENSWRHGRANMSAYRTNIRTGITLPEVLVLVVIVGILLCLLLPALVRGRERTRTNLCQSRITRLIHGVQEFESISGAFPAGSINPVGPIANSATGKLHHNWISQLLPFIGEELVFSRIDPQLSVYHEKHQPVRAVLVSALVCPASPRPNAGSKDEAVIHPSSFAASYSSNEEPLDADANGVFFLNSNLKKSDIVDGEKYTLFLGEVRIYADEDNLGWMSGTRATLRNTSSPPSTTPPPMDQLDEYFMGSFGSWHANFAHMAMGDGRVAAISNSIDPITYQQLGCRDDGSNNAASPPVSATDDN